MTNQVLWLAWAMFACGIAALAAALWPCRPRRPRRRCAWCDRGLSGRAYRVQLFAEPHGSHAATATSHLCSAECVLSYASHLAGGSEYAGMSNPCHAGVR